MIRRLLYWLTGKLPAREIRGDDGEPYLERYYLGRCFGLTCYVHHFVASDPGRGLHDHPWARSVSFLLAGGYSEQRRAGIGAPMQTATKHAPGINIIRGTDFHRVNLPAGTTVWTLFIHGQCAKKWGFLDALASETPSFRWRQAVYTGGDDDAGTWWQRCPTGRELRAAQNQDFSGFTDALKITSAIVEQQDDHP